MRKILFAFVALVAVFVYAQDAKAVTIVEGPNAEKTLERYAGSIVVQTTEFGHYYWYVDKNTQTRYYLEDGQDVSRVMRLLAEGISNYNLDKIATSANDKNADYNLTHKMRGKFLLQVEKNGEAWYVNPLDNYIYSIPTGKEGFKILKTMAIDIDDVRLNFIPIAENTDIDRPQKEAIDFDRYWTIWNTLKTDYYKPDQVEDLDLFYGSLQGMADAIDDPYTTFFTPRKKTDFFNNIEGSLEGIGAMVDVKDNRLFIIAPLDDTPAKAAGLMPEDQVIQVDDTNIEGFSLDDAVNLIKGPAGTDVLLKIYRPTTQEIFDVIITRAKIEIPTITGQNLGNNIAYFKINTFALDLPTKFSEIKNDYINNNTKGVIIDLRNNPGGYTSAAIQLADYWLEPGELILREKWPDQTYQYTASSAEDVSLPTIVLVNNGTASAAEIFTSALSENFRAESVGINTIGKGTGQTVHNFPDGSALKFTVFEWLTPDGHSIQDNGLTPDYIIENTLTEDLQLEKAKNLLK
jgi:carboxyl-terminal processing protease